MALKSTVYKIKISISDLSKNHYRDYVLTLAKHPSETNERLVCRIIAFALNSSDDLVLGKGLSDDKEPDLWEKSLDGRILKWIEIGHPDEKKLRRLSGQAESVEIFSYQRNASQVWWEGIQKKAAKLPKLRVTYLNGLEGADLSSLTERTMELNCVIEDNILSISSESRGGNPLTLEIEKLK